MKFIICCFFFITFINSFSQKEYIIDIERSQLIKEQLSDKDKSKIISLEGDENKAESLMDIADDYYKQLGVFRRQLDDIKDRKERKKILKKTIKVENKALKNRIESLDNYHEVVVQKYQIYKNDLQKFLKTAKKPKVDSAKVWAKLAYDSFERADVKVQIAYHTVSYGDIFDIYTEAYKLEQIGILYQEQMYGVFLGWSQADLKRINDEIFALQKNEPLNSPAEEAFVSDYIEHTIDSVVYEKVIVYDTVTVKEKIPGLIFKIQIAASKTPLSIAALRKIYYADDIINTVIENGWYKYSVGMFDTYREARKFKMIIGVRDSFVVVYKRGKKIEVPNTFESKQE
ncbi:MAG: hypothetical protein ABFS35_04410 [Bacteroidota bacterium]